MIITSVEKNVKVKDQFLVYVDGEYSFSIDEEDYYRLNLYEKKDITAEEIDYIRNTANLTRAKSSAVRYLSLKIRSEKEVKDRLEQEGFSRDIIDKAIQELKSMGYINDKIYAQKYVYDRSKLNPKSKRLIKYELESKGIASDAIDEILEDWSVDESDIAESLVKKKFGKYDLQDEKVIKKICSFLQHRGFDYGIINDLINKIKLCE